MDTSVVIDLDQIDPEQPPTNSQSAPLRWPSSRAARTRPAMPASELDAKTDFADTRGKAAMHAQVTPMTNHIKAWFTSE
jgi:hypothetical protein